MAVSRGKLENKKLNTVPVQPLNTAPDGRMNGKSERILKEEAAIFSQNLPGWTEGEH